MSSRFATTCGPSQMVSGLQPPFWQQKESGILQTASAENRMIRQTCKACLRPDKFDFHVPDDVWAAVVPPTLINRVVCLDCFDRFAREKNIPYAHCLDTLYFAGDQAVMMFRTVTANTPEAA